jgi:hypothetical protein
MKLVYLLIIKFIRERNIMVEKSITNRILSFYNYKSAGINITNYVVTVLKCEIIIDIHCSLKTVLYLNFIS